MRTHSSRKLALALLLLVLGGMLLSACNAAPSGTGGGGDENDLLAAILERGTIVVSTDPAYPPQSELVEGEGRAEGTKCATDQQTANQLAGFDIDTAKAIAERLGVEACFVSPSWEAITAGGWADRWDISVGSMTITEERLEPLYFTQPYYTTPAAFFVHRDNTTFTGPADLAGAKIGVCADCTYDHYLQGNLSIPGITIDYLVTDAEIMTYDTDTTALEDLALGDGTRLNAVLTAQPTGQGVIDDGRPLKQLGDPIYFEYLAVAVDKSHSRDPISLVQRLNEVLAELHSDGTMLEISQQYYGLDLTSAAADFDVANLGQLP